MKISVEFVHNRQKKKLKKGQATIVQCRLHSNYQTKYFDTGLRITPDQWDEKRRQVKNHPNAQRLNIKFEQLKEKAKKYQERCFIESTEPDLQELANILQGKDHSSDFIKFCESQLAHKKTKLAQSTTKQHSVLVSYLTKFTKGKKLPMSRLSPLLVNEFEIFLSKQRAERKKTNLSANYIASLMRIFKSYTREAHRLELIKKEPFTDYQFTTEEKENFTLTLDQVKKIADLDLSQRRGNVAERRDVFVLCCLIGWPYADINGLKRKHISGKTGSLIARKKRHKTRNSSGAEFVTPLSKLFGGWPEQVIRPYLKGKMPEATVFNHIDLTAFNKNIKEFLKLAGINALGKKIGSHIARHTAKDLFEEQGMPIQLIGQLLAHTEVKTTQGYGTSGYQDLGAMVSGYF